MSNDSMQFLLRATAFVIGVLALFCAAAYAFVAWWGILYFAFYTMDGLPVPIQSHILAKSLSWLGIGIGWSVYPLLLVSLIQLYRFAKRGRFWSWRTLLFAVLPILTLPVSFTLIMLLESLVFLL